MKNFITIHRLLQLRRLQQQTTTHLTPHGRDKIYHVHQPKIHHYKVTIEGTRMKGCTNINPITLIYHTQFDTSLVFQTLILVSIQVSQNLG